jgi:hypothetical protein
LFTDQSPSGGANYAVMYRDTSGGQPVRIGEGSAAGLSTDGAWALAYVPSSRGYALYPLGPGDPVRLDRFQAERLTQCTGPRMISTFLLSAVASRQSLRAVIGRPL